MRNCRKGFTLTEMAVVMGMIVLFIGIAIPTVRALTGQSSINMARNQLSALFVRVREEAIAMQDYRGVLFMLEKTSDRVICVDVQQASNTDYTHFPGSMIFLDAVPNRDTIALPLGVRLQTLYNGLDTATSTPGTDDRYMGFNPVIKHTPGAPDPPEQRYYGGCILFDGNGNLVVKPYALQLALPNPTGSLTTAVVSRLGVLLATDQNSNWSSNSGAVSYYVQFGVPTSTAASSCAIVPGSPTPVPSPPTGPFVVSQVGLVLFDGDAFKTLGFTDEDANLVPNGAQKYTSPWINSGISEQTEEMWLDNNSTPVMINRYDGTLIRGE